MQMNLSLDIHKSLKRISKRANYKHYKKIYVKYFLKIDEIFEKNN